MRLIAKKPCAFCGQQFFVGDEIPAELVVNPVLQEQYGILSILSNEYAAEIDETVKPEGITIPIFMKDEGGNRSVLTTTLSVGEVQEILTIMQTAVPDAEKSINEIDSEDALIVLSACDSRSGIKKAAKKRADILFPATTGKDDAGNGTGLTDSAEEK